MNPKQLSREVILKVSLNLNWFTLREQKGTDFRAMKEILWLIITHVVTDGLSLKGDWPNLPPLLLLAALLSVFLVQKIWKIFSICYLWRKKGEWLHDGTWYNRSLKTFTRTHTPFQQQGFLQTPLGTRKALLEFHTITWDEKTVISNDSFTIAGYPGLRWFNLISKCPMKDKPG